MLKFIFWRKGVNTKSNIVELGGTCGNGDQLGRGKVAGVQKCME